MSSELTRPAFFHSPSDNESIGAVDDVLAVCRNIASVDVLRTVEKGSL